MTVPSASYAPPGAEFLERVATSAWVGTSASRTCWVLITPAQPRPTESVEKYRPGLLGIAEGLGLGRGAAVPAGVSRGLLLVGGLASLDYGHPETTMNVDYPEPWYRQAMVNGHVHVMLGTALMKGTGAEGARDYLTAYYGTDAMWSGLVAWRRELPASWLGLGKPT